MYDAMHAFSDGAVPEISKSSSAEGDEDYATLLRRAAVRISWLLVFVLRNTSTSTTPATTATAAGSATASLQAFLQALIQNLGAESSLSTSTVTQPGALVQATA